MCLLVFYAESPLPAPGQGDVLSVLCSPSGAQNSAHMLSIFALSLERPPSGRTSAITGGRGGTLSFHTGESHPTPNYTAEIHKLTCCPQSRMAAAATMLFLSATSSRGGLAAGRGKREQPRPPPHSPASRRIWAGGDNACVGTRLKGEMSWGAVVHLEV